MTPVALDSSVTIATMADRDAPVTATRLKAMRPSATGDHEPIPVDDRSPHGGAIPRLFRSFGERQRSTQISESRSTGNAWPA